MKALLSDYKPHENARLFHESNNKNRIITASVRSGKTWATIHEIIKVAWNNNKRNTYILLIAPTYLQLKDILLRPLYYKLLSYGLIESTGWNKSDNIIQLKNGNLIIGRSNESYMRMEGITVAETYIDEVCRVDKDCVEECKRRMITTNGRLNLIGTPKGKNNWVYKEYFENGYKQDWDYFKFNIFDNPEVKKEAVESLLEQYDELTAKQEIYGEWVSLTEDRIYKDFDNNNIKEPSEQRDIFIGIDWNIGIYAATVMTKINDKLYVINEYSDNKDVVELANKIVKEYGTSPYIITDAMNSQSNRLLLRQSGLNNIFETKSNPKRVDRYQMVNAWIKNAKGERKLFVSNKCKNLIKDLETMEYKKGTDIPDDNNNERGHWVDALGYVIWNNFKINPNEVNIVNSYGHSYLENWNSRQSSSYQQF